MADAGREPAGPAGSAAAPAHSGPIALRLTLAFVAVALAAVALLAGLTAAFRRRPPAAASASHWPPSSPAPTPVS